MCVCVCVCFCEAIGHPCLQFHATFSCFMINVTERDENVLCFFKICSRYFIFTTVIVASLILKLCMMSITFELLAEAYFHILILMITDFYSIDFPLICGCLNEIYLRLCIARETSTASGFSAGLCSQISLQSLINKELHSFFTVLTEFDLL